MNKRLYSIFFQEGKMYKFRKLIWFIMIMIQEALMCKWKAILKYFYKTSYRRDINVLMDVLSKGKLTSRPIKLSLEEVNFSHEINYPKWVEYLEKRLREDIQYLKPLKVFYIEEEKKYIVIDGNHRLKALKRVFNQKEIFTFKEVYYKS